MDSVSADEIRDLILKIKALAAESAQKRTVEDHTDDRVASLTHTAFVDLPLTPGGELDLARWTALSPQEQADRTEMLMRLRDSLEMLTGSDGPTDPRSFMYRDYVSNRGVIALSLFSIVGTLALLCTIYFNWTRATSNTAVNPAAVSGPNVVSTGPQEKDVLLMVMLMGALGGFIHLTGSLTKYIGNRQFVRSWILYYLLMPLEGAGLAVTVYLMVRVGVLNPAASNGEATKNLNWVGIYALGVLAGLFSKQALEMLGDVFNTIFRRVEAKDAGGKANPSDEPDHGRK